MIQKRSRQKWSFFYGQADAELFVYLNYNYEMYAVFDYAIVVV